MKLTDQPLVMPHTNRTAETATNSRLLKIIIKDSNLCANLQAIEKY
jgi:hypothetical protein